jgi:tetratricopeptide (TPR) repeat protein
VKHRLAAHERFWTTLAVLCCLVFLAPMAAASGRVTFAVIPPSLDGTNQGCAHWQYLLPLLLKEQLRQIPTVHIPPDGSLEFENDEAMVYAYLELQHRHADGLTGACQLGEAVGANKLLWSSIECDSGQIAWSGVVLDVLKRNKSQLLTATPSNALEVVCQMRKLVLHELGAQVPTEIAARLDTPPTHSAAALELTSHALFKYSQGGQIALVQENLERAVSIDPAFGLANEALACILLLQDKVHQADAPVREAIRRAPLSARAHYLWGGILAQQRLYPLAREQFGLAHQYNPDDPFPVLRMGELLGRDDGQWVKALSLLLQAEHLDPRNALVHEELGTAYFHLGDLAKATAEFRKSARFDSGEDGLLDLRLADGYALIGDAPRAVARYEAYLAGVEKIGLESSALAYAKNALADQRLRLSPHPVQAAIPRIFDAAQLDAALRGSLPAEQLKLVINPLAGTLDMTNWENKEILGVGADIDKAQHVFSVLKQHAGVTDTGGGRTAQESFSALKDPEAKLSCQESAFLYVALARAVGLKAFFVVVNRDYQSNFVAHACAGVFIGKHAFLVDPSYQWFGVPHSDYRFLNDIETTGFYLAQLDIPHQRCAIKLLPNSPLPRFWLASALAQDGKTDEALKILHTGVQLDSTSWWSFLARGIVDLYCRNFDAAIPNLERCAHLNPTETSVRFYLGEAYRMTGLLAVARQEYRNYLEQQKGGDFAEAAQHALTSINERIERNAASDPVQHKGPTNVPQDADDGTL